MPSIDRSQLAARLRRVEPRSPLAVTIESCSARRLDGDRLVAEVRSFEQLGGPLSRDERQLLERVTRLLGANPFVEVVEEGGRPGGWPQLRAFSSLLAPRRLDGGRGVGGTPWSTMYTQPGGALPVLSPDRESLILHGGNGRLARVSAAGGREAAHQLVGVQGFATPAFSPDGESLYVVNAGPNSEVLWVLDPEQLTLGWTLAIGSELSESVRSSSPVPSPDGKSLLLAGRSGELLCIDVASRSVRWREQVGPGIGESQVSPAVSPDSRRVYQLDTQGRVYAFDVATGKAPWPPLALGAGQAGSARVTPDGKRLLVPIGDTLHAVDTTSGKPEWKAEIGRVNALHHAEVTQDGTRAVVSTLDARLRVIEVASGQILRTIRSPAPIGLCHAPVLTSDERAAVVQDQNGSFFRMNLVTGDARMIAQTGVASQLGGFILSPDGRRAFHANDNATVYHATPLDP